jgi:hypothetical protein
MRMSSDSAGFDAGGLVVGVMDGGEVVVGALRLWT